MTDKPNLGELIKEAQKMQTKMQEAQKELEKMSVTGEAGGGMVKIVMTGHHEAKEVTIHESLMDDKEMLQDLISAAITDGARKIRRETQSKMMKLTEGLKLPPDFKMPSE